MEDWMTRMYGDKDDYHCLSHYREDLEQRYLKYKQDNHELNWEEIITRVAIGLDRDYYTEVIEITDPDSFTVLVNKYRQLARDYIPGDLEMIAPEYNDSTLMLRHSARTAFERMCKAANHEGIALKAISTFRSYLYQNQVYYKNWNEETSLKEYQAIRDRVSARAGHSEHQTGLAVDINDLEQTFAETPEGEWLMNRSWEFGFILRYPKGKETITGYDYEPWHFRYLGPELAENIYWMGITYDEYYVRYLGDHLLLDEI